MERKNKKRWNERKMHVEEEGENTQREEKMEEIKKMGADGRTRSEEGRSKTTTPPL